MLGFCESYERSRSLPSLLTADIPGKLPDIPLIPGLFTVCALCVVIVIIVLIWRYKQYVYCIITKYLSLLSWDGIQVINFVFKFNLSIYNDDLSNESWLKLEALSVFK